MTAPAEAQRYARDLLAEKRAALASVAFSWSQMGDDFDASWRRVGPRIVTATEAAQLEVATLAARYVGDVAPLTVSRLHPPEYTPDAKAWVGVAGDGRPVESLAQQAVIRAKVAVGDGATAYQALEQSGKWLSVAMGTVVADTHRGVEQVGLKARRIGMYVRMLNHPSCGRCVILAGKTFRSSTAFQRHPGCDCVHIPASQDIAGDLTTDPSVYLDSLDDDELAKALGSKANAQAYRDGADANQLVNAYRKGAVQKAQLYGKTELSFTTEGVTRRGSAYQAMSARHSAFQRELDVKGGRYRSAQVQRLMPSSIYELAKDPADAQRLLRTYGWIL